MHSYSALYYPFIHFKSDRWLKLSALYWDDMSRIVPSQYEPEDTQTVKDLGDFVKTVRPDWVRPEFGKTFVEFVAEYGSRLEPRYGLAHVDTWTAVPESERPPRAGGSSGTDPRLGYVFYEKMSPDLAEVLRTSGLASLDPYDPKWIGMHPRMARVYMTALADRLAAERGLHPLAEEPLDHLVVGGGTIGRLAHALLEPEGGSLLSAAPSAGEVETVAAFVAVQAAVPRDIEEVPAQKILEFRARHLAERGAFQTYLSSFLEKRAWLGTVEGPELLAERLKTEYQKDLEPKLAELRAKLRSSGIESVNGVLTVQVATPWLFSKGAAIAGLAVAPVVPVIGLGAGAAFAVGKIWRDRQKARGDARRASPVSYLLRAEEDLAPASVLGWIKQKAGRVFGD